MGIKSKNKENAMRKCALCGGNLKEGTISQIYEWHDKIIVVRGVPAKVCADCGEGYLISSTVKHLDEMVKNIKKFSPQTAIVKYEDKEHAMIA